MPRGLENFGAVGVDIFFVISGYIITKTATRASGPADFMKRRLIRVVPLYYLLSLPWIAIGLCARRPQQPRGLRDLHVLARGRRPNSRPGADNRLDALLRDALLRRDGGLSRIRTRWFLIAILACFLLCWLARAYSGHAVFRFLGNPIILEFLFGVLIAKLTARGSAPIFGLACAAAGATALVTTAILGFGDISESHLITTGELSLRRVLLWGLPAALLVLGAATSSNWGSGFVYQGLVRLGDASYSLYLVHQLSFLIFFPLAMLMPQAIALTAFAIGILSGALVHATIERPMLRALAPGRDPKAQPELH